MLKILGHTDSKEFFELIVRNREFLRKWITWVDYKRTEEEIKDLIKSSLMLYAEEKS